MQLAIKSAFHPLLKSSRVATWTSLLALTLLIFCIYYPGKSGPFLADDYPNIIENAGIQIHNLTAAELSSAWSANRSGFLGRHIPSLSFALNYLFAGQQFDPVHFKLTNIVFHIINSLLVFFISRILFSISSTQYPAQKLAYICALIWAVHPLHLTSVLYVVQRMTSLACLFMLGGFLIFLKGRIQIKKPGSITLMYAGCLFGISLGGLSKENALLLPYLMLITEITLLRKVPASTARNKLYFFYCVTAIIPAIIAIGYMTSHPQIFMNGYINREFTLVERLMTQARALLYYLGLLFYPDNTQLSLSHDDFTVSRSLFDPLTTFPAILFIVILLTVAIVNCIRNKAPFYSFAVLWFFTAQSMESTIFPLEMIYEHRNYVPSIGIIIGTIALIHPLYAKLEKKALLNLLYGIMIISLAFASFTRSVIWSGFNSYVHFEVRNHPLSVRAHSTYAKNIEVHNGPITEVYEHHRIAAQLDEHEVSELIEMFFNLQQLVLIPNVLSEETQISLPEHYDEKLILNTYYVQAIKALIHKEIIRRLTHKSNPLHTAISLRIAATCLLNARPDCINSATNILEWTDAVLVHPDFPEMSLIYTIRAKIFFYLGDLEKALADISMAIQLAPNEMYYYAEKANLHTLLNQFGQAEEVINDAIAHHGRFSGFDMKQLNISIKMLEDRKAEVEKASVTNEIN
ncbi:tetratricopeptide repeat protein [Methylobacter marinus]|uniref:tetratricopeptide repeat protein n=1 Tax=Methylobacter marinus TaxID=34058 RepID=UPI00035D5B96|nr:tetratricopeptide repeat protein [Methylobacter marinus]